MKYVLLGLVVTMALSIFMVAWMSKALFVEVREFASKGRPDRRD